MKHPAKPTTYQGLMEAQSKMIDRVAEALQTDRSTAGLMLMYTGWQEAVTLRRYRLENLLFAQACGVTPKEECDVGDLESGSESNFVRTQNGPTGPIGPLSHVF